MYILILDLTIESLLSREVEGLGPMKPGNQKVSALAFKVLNPTDHMIWKIRGGSNEQGPLLTKGVFLLPLFKYHTKIEAIRLNFSRRNGQMSQFEFKKPETTLLHAGQESADPATNSRALPIYQTTSYVFNDTEHAQNLFGLAESGNIYSRLTNPTVAAFEERVAQLEDGVAAVAVSSGMAAITFAILNIARTGDEIIADSNLYGGTYNLFVHTLTTYGIDVKFVDGTDIDAIEAAITSKTKAIFGETITNPSLNVFDIEEVAKVA